MKRIVITCFAVLLLAFSLAFAGYYEIDVLVGQYSYGTVPAYGSEPPPDAEVYSKVTNNSSNAVSGHQMVDDGENVFFNHLFVNVPVNQQDIYHSEPANGVNVGGESTEMFSEWGSGTPSSGDKVNFYLEWPY